MISLGQPRAVDHEVEGQDDQQQQAEEQRQDARGQHDDVAQDGRADGVDAPGELVRIQRRAGVEHDRAVVVEQPDVGRVLHAGDRAGHALAVVGQVVDDVGDLGAERGHQQQHGRREQHQEHDVGRG